MVQIENIVIAKRPWALWQSVASIRRDVGTDALQVVRKVKDFAFKAPLSKGGCLAKQGRGDKAKSLLLFKLCLVVTLIPQSALRLPAPLSVR